MLDVPLSRLMLGTAQFGMPYGIANRTGRPAYEEARDIVRCAFEGGVRCFDTAAGYGDSEEVLGRTLAELGIAREVTVVTKLRHLKGEAASVSAEIEDSVASSLKRLRLACLPICLFHREEDFRHTEALLALRDRGLVRHVGCSTMTPDAAREIVRSGLAEAVQIPTNLLDHRFTHGGVCALAAERGVALFVRSVYLQGLILLPDQSIHPALHVAIPPLAGLRELATQAGITLKEMAARYPLGLPGVMSVLVGVESVAQMQENLALFDKGPLRLGLMRAIAQAVPDLPDALLMPNRWPAQTAPAR